MNKLTAVEGHLHKGQPVAARHCGEVCYTKSWYESSCPPRSALYADDAMVVDAPRAPAHSLQLPSAAAALHYYFTKPARSRATESAGDSSNLADAGERSANLPCAGKEQAEPYRILRVTRLGLGARASKYTPL